MLIQRSTKSRCEERPADRRSGVETRIPANHPQIDSGIVERSAYQDRPTRYAYRLTPRGRALLPVLVALQDWGDRWLLGDGSLTGTNEDDEPPAHRIHQLTGQRIPRSGCTLENRLFAARYDEFAAERIVVRGVSTQRPDEQRAFAAAEEIPHTLLSDLDLELAAALRLPTFRAGGYERLKRVVLVIGPDRVVQAVRYPVTDIAEAVEWALTRKP